MRLVIELALRDLMRDRLHLICNVAVLAGAVVPILVLFGVKNGVYEMLVGRLLASPATLQVDTVGNNVFSAADAEVVRGWPEAAFVTLKTRSLFDFVNVAPDGRTGKRDALLSPSGSGDPVLPAGLDLGPGDVAISDALARALDLAAGDRVRLVTQAEDRPRQLALPATVAGVLAPDRGAGRIVLAPVATLDLIEAFYDGYAVPEHGVPEGRDLAARTPSYEGIRAYARTLQELAPLQARIEERFGVRTEARTAEVEGVLGLGRNLDLALLLTATVAALGLVAALLFGFWAEVARKRTMIATLSLLGIRRRAVALFPVTQAVATAVIGLAVSAALFAVAAAIATRLFGGDLGEARVVVVGPAAWLAIGGLVLVLVVGASLLAAHRAQATAPAVVLREWS